MAMYIGGARPPRYAPCDGSQMIAAGTTYDTPLTEFNFTTRQLNTLATHDIVTVGDVMHWHNQPDGRQVLKRVGVVTRTAMLNEVIIPWKQRQGHYARQTT